MSAVEYETSKPCPACGEKSVDPSVEAFDGVCESCGYVIRGDVNSTPPDWEIIDGTFEESGKRDWLDVCRIHNATEKRLAHAFRALEEIAECLALSGETRDEAADIFCQAFREEITDGRDSSCLIAASLRLASRRVERPIPASRLTEFPDVDEKKFHLCHTALMEGLDIERRSPKPVDFVPFLDNEFAFTRHDRRKVSQVIQSVEGEQSFVGKDPSGVAAGCVYIQMEDYTQREVAEAVGVSVETVRKRANQIREAAENV